VGLDLGVAATTAVIAKIYIPNDTDITLFSNVVIIVLDTLQSTNTSLNDFCANHLVPYFRSRNIPPKRVLIFADPSSKSREISTGFSTIRLLNSTYGYRYCLDNRKKRREIGTESARAMLQQKRLFIMEHCDKLIEAMLNYNTSGKSQHAISKDPYGHYCDALRYLVSRIAPLERMLSKEEYNKLLKESYDPNGNVE
jgi:hypothetical protein